MFSSPGAIHFTIASTLRTTLEQNERRFLRPGGAGLSALAANGQQGHSKRQIQAAFQAEDWNQKIIQASLKPRNRLSPEESPVQKPSGHPESVHVSGLLHTESSSPQLRAQRVTLISPEVPDRLVHRPVERSHAGNHDTET